MVWRRESATLKPPGDEPRGRDIPQILRPGRPRIGPSSLAGAERGALDLFGENPGEPPAKHTNTPTRPSEQRVHVPRGTISDGQTPIKHHYPGTGLCQALVDEDHNE